MGLWFAPEKRVVNREQLMEEARQLARPCIDLTQDEGAPLAAIWGGVGLVPPPSSQGLLRHGFSIDCRFLPAGYEDLRGCFSVYVDEDEWTEDEGGIVTRDEAIQLTDKWYLAGTKLFAHSSLSWPWIDAIFRFGSPFVEEWLTDCGWQPEWPYNGNFRDSKVVEDYEEFLRQQDPYFGEMEQVFVRLGGWHLPWPDGDWAELLDKRLVAMTYHDAEPWLEVWTDDKRNFEVLQRIT